MVRVRRLGLLLVAWGCAPAAEGVPAPVGEAPEVDDGLGEALTETLERALLIRARPLLEVVERVQSDLDPACWKEVGLDVGAMLQLNCNHPGTQRALGEVVWFDGEGPLRAEAEAWAGRWVPAAGADLDAALAGLARSAWVVGRMGWVDFAGPVVHLWGEASEAVLTWPGGAARWAMGDGPMEDREADPATWPGGAVSADVLTVGQVAVEGGGVVLTVDGALGGLAGAWPTAHVVGGAWWADGGCVDEPAGTWSLRDPSGRWVDLVFDPEVACDGCGVARSVGAEDAPWCLPEGLSDALSDRAFEAAL